MHIYLVTNLINGKQYVGQTTLSVEERWKEHLKKARAGKMNRLYCAIRKYGQGAFIAEGLTGCDNQEQMNRLENLWITLLKTYDYKYGYNMTFGGDGCAGIDEVKDRMRKSISKAMLGRPCPQGTRESTGNRFRGQPKPLSQRQKIAAHWNPETESGKARREKQAEVARQVNAIENAKLKDYKCPTCGEEFQHVTKGVYGGHRKACLYWNSSTSTQ
jgi:group I intron endonuclease